jgi:2,3-bisphosphoglycerate-independent phosphoglycerate mutase
MKYLIIIPDGAADEPQDELAGQTPLAAAATPALDALATRGVVGQTNHVPGSLNPGSEVACMSLIGYDPLEFFTGRAPLEAAAKGIELGPDDWAVRCNLVTIVSGADGPVMADFTADHISTAEATSLLEAAQAGLARDFPNLAGWQFAPGVSYRNLLIYRANNREPVPLAADLRTTAPHDRVGQPINDAFPRGTGSRLLTDIMGKSESWLANHPVNQARQAAGQGVATHLWLWGAGRRPAFPPFFEQYGLTGTMITAVDLLRGLANLAGWSCREVAGATGYLDTDYAAKGRAAIEELSQRDLVCVHVEAPDEAGHEGNATAKVKAIEEIDRHIVGPAIAHLEERATGGEEYRVLICPDHPTFLATRMHSRGMVPYLMAGAGIQPSGQQAYSEEAATAGPLIEPGWQLMGNFLRSSSDATVSAPERT